MTLVAYLSYAKKFDRSLSNIHQTNFDEETYDTTLINYLFNFGNLDISDFFVKPSENKIENID